VFRIVSGASLRDAAKTTRLDCRNSQSSRFANDPELKIVEFVAIVFTAAKRRWKRWLAEAPYGARNALAKIWLRRTAFREEVA